jgi:hypothetical protein
MKMRVKRRKQLRHCLQGWLESPGYLAGTIRNKEKRRLLRERFLRGDYQVIDGEFWMRDLKL